MDEPSKLHFQDLNSRPLSNCRLNKPIGRDSTSFGFVTTGLSKLETVSTKVRNLFTHKQSSAEQVQITLSNRSNKQRSLPTCSHVAVVLGVVSYRACVHYIISNKKILQHPTTALTDVF